MNVKGFSKYLPIWMIIAHAVCRPGVFAQTHDDAFYASIGKNYPDSIVVFTDRTLYAVNESIRFSALLHSWLKPYPDADLQVMYVELLNSSGESVVKGKYPVREHRSSGSLDIPASLYTGLYYLRCYTRWMRNFGPADFAYIPLRIVNPYSQEVDAAKASSAGHRLEPVHPGAEKINIILPGRSFHPGEVIGAGLSIGSAETVRAAEGCITVVPEGTIDTSMLCFQVSRDPDDPALFQIDFFPEMNGIAISGEVHDSVSKQPASGIMLHISLLGEIPSYFVTDTDEQGRFLLSTPPGTGNRELFVAPVSPSGQPLEVRIDNDYAPDGLPFKPETFALQKDEYLLASRLSLQMQLGEIFLTRNGTDNTGSPGVQDSVPFYGGPFYGGPWINVKLDEFINLPNMEEVFENLVPQTYVTKRNGLKSLWIKSENPMTGMYAPLMLVDHLPVFDAETILSIPPSKVDHIDVVPEVYIKGDMKFGGIISISTRKMDWGGIQLPAGSYFFDYEYFKAPEPPQHPRYVSAGSIPDTRNTLFWTDHVKLEKGASAGFEFPAAAVPGSYLILFRGVSSDGEPVCGSARFKVEIKFNN